MSEETKTLSIDEISEISEINEELPLVSEIVVLSGGHTGGKTATRALVAEMAARSAESGV